MKLLILIGLIGLSLTFKVGSNLDLKWEPVLQGLEETSDDQILNMYLDFLAHYSKDMTDKLSTMQRFSIFKENVKTMIAFNSDKTKTWEMGVNEYTDLTDAEFEARFPLIPRD